jgi:NADH:ubiquinone oxidoreductase subunit F (NADH-binding)
LLESLEGRPGKPRIRPPFPVSHGYLGQPTAVDNVETLALAARIALDSASGRLADTSFSAADRAAGICPVGTIVRKRVGFAQPIGRREYDRHRIGKAPGEAEGEAAGEAAPDPTWSTAR